MARVLVLGGGFGGLAASTRLRRLLPEGDEVVLVARDARFAMGWTKIWELVGIRPLAEGTRELHRLAEHGIRFVNAEVDAIVAEERGAVTSEGELGADALVVALGVCPNPDQAAQLDGRRAHDLYSFEALPAARSGLEEFTEGHLLVAVLGQPFQCPPAPFEAVLAVDEHLRQRGERDGTQLTISTPAPSALPVAGPDASATVAAALAARDIALRTEQLPTEVDADRGRVVFDSGEAVEVSLLLGVPGAVPPAAVATSALAGPGGWIRPDPRTLETDHPGVYAVGDCTTVPTATAALPKAGVFAAAEGEVAARNIAAELGHGEPARFDGHGSCFLELPGQEVAVVEGEFFAEPAPEVTMTPPSRAAYERKLAYERERLTEWFGG